MVWQGDNFGIALKALARAIEPDRPALVQGERIVGWSQLDSLTDRIAAGLTARGLKPGDVAGQMLRNTPDYILAYFGCIKAGVTPVNVNYHYKDRELADIFSRFGLKALFVESDFANSAGAAMPDGALTIDVGSTGWADLQSSVVPPDFAAHDDKQALFFTATGGTTGMPKAVMWPFEAAWQAFGISVWQRGMGEPPFVATSLEEQAAEAAKIGPDHPASTSPLLLLSPLMHGPSCSIGFCVARTGKGFARLWVAPAIETCRSCIACKSADWVRGLARLISSAINNSQKIGPFTYRKCRLPASSWSNNSDPKMSLGIRSGVNCTRDIFNPHTVASVSTNRVFPKPGTPTNKQCPPANTALSD